MNTPNNSCAPDITSVVVLISGRGSNLRALLHHQSHGRHYKIVKVISDRADAAGLAIAAQHDIPSVTIGGSDRNRRLLETVEAAQPNLVVLAGFMRILDDDFVNHFADRLINIHPSLLPAYPGLRTHERALAAEDAWHGCSVHLVTAEVDAGAVLAQSRLAVTSGESVASLAARVLELEHGLLPRCVELIATGDVQARHGSLFFRGEPLNAPLLL